MIFFERGGINILEEEVKTNQKPILKGICLSIAAFIKSSVTFVRLIFIFLAFINGIGILLYIFIWLFIPNKVWESKD